MIACFKGHFYQFMLHYGIIAIGSRGDVQPFVALSLGLLRKGNRVTLMAHENFRSFVQDHGIDFHPLAGSTEEILQSPEAVRHLQTGNTFRLLRSIHERGGKWQTQMNRDLWEGCLRPEVLVTGALGIHWISSIAEKMGKRWAVIQLSFPTNATREFPFAGFDFPAFDFFKFPAYNRATFRLLRSFFWRRVKTSVNEHRQSLGLPALQQSIFDKADSEHILTCYAVSPALLQRPADWDDNIQVTGFLSMPALSNNASKNIPGKLLEWLGTGDRPIYIGLGSMPIPDPARFTRILRELLTRTSYRFIFCQGWSALPGLPLDSRFLVVPSIPHEWLFLQCQAAIIHGGVGTLAAALRAGIPTVVLSIFGDQHWWGKLILKRRLGCHITFKRLSVEKLMAAVQNVLAPEIAQNLAGLARELNGEDGLQNAVDRLEGYFLEGKQG